MSGLPGTSARECLTDGLQVEETAGAKTIVEQVLITRGLFDSHIKGHVFGSWEEMVATLADKPSVQGYTALRGESTTVVRLDPSRVFAWVAAVLIFVSVGFVSATCAPPFAVVILLGYGMAIWQVLSRSLAPQVAGVLWPMLPVVVATAGFVVAGNVADGNKDRMLKVCALLFLSLLPHLAITAFLMRSLQQDPDRATLVVNLLAGVWAVICCPAIVFDGGEFTIHLCEWSALLLGLASLGTGARLFFVPGKWGSVELVSWTLNVGAFAVFTVWIPLCGIWSEDALPWLLFLPAPLVLTLLGQVFGRSLPPVLGAFGLLMLMVRIGSLAVQLGGSLAGLFVFGACGLAVMLAGGFLQGSERWAFVVVQTRALLARLCGSKDPTHFWTQAAAASPAVSEPSCSGGPELALA